MSWFSMFNRRRALLSCALAILSVLVAMKFWHGSSKMADSPRENMMTKPINSIPPIIDSHQNQAISPEKMCAGNVCLFFAATVILLCVVALVIYVTHLRTTNNVTPDKNDISRVTDGETREDHDETSMLTATNVGLAVLIILLLVGIVCSVSAMKESTDLAYFEGTFAMGRKVGSGWVATAFLATRLTDNQPFVVKLSDRPVCVTTEAAILSRFHHENIVQFMEQRRMKDGKKANIYEYIDSGTLDDLIESELKLNEDELSAIASQLLCALAVMQDEHIAHRDIHPKNIMLHSDGTVKLIDFDWAVEETKATVFKERAEHMAPEIYRAETATCKADVWSVGYCVAWFRGNPRFGVPVDAFGMADPNLSRIKGSAAFMDFLQLALMTSVDERPSARDLQQHDFVRLSAGREKEIVRGILK